MHSSRMRTARSSGRPGGYPQGTPGAGTPLEQATPRSRQPPEADTPQSRHPPDQTPPGPGIPLLTESQTPVKTLPCPNFVADGKNIKEVNNHVSGFFRIQSDLAYSNIPWV